MRNSTFKPKVPQRERRDRSDEFASWSTCARAPAPGSGVVMAAIAQVARPVPKTPGRRSQAIRDSARGEACEIRLPGCDGGGETTVWCHLPEAVAGRGMALKGIDLLGAYGCRSCHDIVDRRAPRPGAMTEHDIALAFYRALARSVVKLKQKGLL